MSIAKYIEHSFLIPTAILADIEKICKEAIEHNFAAVCVPPMFVKKATELISGFDIKVATVIGFPYGYNLIEPKLAETVLAIVDGADEVDVMINMIALKNKDWQYLAKEINIITGAVRKGQKKIKVIIEAGLLHDGEIITCCDIYGAASVDFVQLTTGVSEKIVGIETVQKVRTHLADAVRLKSHIDTALHAVDDWLEAGLTRIVCKDPVVLFEKAIASNAGMVFENKARD